MREYFGVTRVPLLDINPLPVRVPPFNFLFDKYEGDCFDLFTAPAVIASVGSK